MTELLQEENIQTISEQIQDRIGQTANGNITQERIESFENEELDVWKDFGFRSIMELQNQNIQTISEQIQERIGQPVNGNVIQAMIESFGIREVDVWEDFGFQSIKELAACVHQKALLIRKAKLEEQFVEVQEIKEIDPFYKKALVFLRFYFIELFHLSPVFFQVVLIVIFGYSLWTYTGFNLLQATAVVLGVVMGFVLSGGFVAVISRQISFYWNFEDEEKVFQSTVFFLKKGISFLVVGSLLILGFAIILGLFPFEMIIIILAYSLMVGTVLLCIAPLYVLKRRLVITLSVYAGTLVSLFLKLTTTLSVYLDHFFGILALVSILITYMIFYFKNRKSNSGGIKEKQMFKPYLFYNNYVYLLYGISFYFFIFLDRLVAWSSPRGIQLSDFILFDKDYEVGMDLALVSYFMMSGIFEYCISTFATDMDTAQNLVESNQVHSYGNVFLKNYKKNVLLLFFVASLAGLIQFYLIYSPHGYKYYFDEILSLINIEVCLYGSIAYFFFCWGALNVLYFFTLGKPKLPVYGLVIGLLFNVVIGMFCSHQFSYHYSVFGLLVGSFVFMLITTRNVLNFFKHIDYYYYAAY